MMMEYFIEEEEYALLGIQWGLQVVLLVLMLINFKPRWQKGVELVKSEAIIVRNMAMFFHPVVYRYLESSLDQVLFAQVSSTTMMVFLLAVSFQIHNFKTRFLVFAFNSGIFVLQGICWEAKHPENLPTLFQEIKTSPTWCIYLFIVSNLMQHIFQLLILNHYQSKLLALSEKHKMQTELHLILHNLDSGLITL